jgi:hypothetical protein
MELLKISINPERRMLFNSITKKGCEKFCFSLPTSPEDAKRK